MRLTGKTAIVTGGGSGFGEGIAKTYAREGANVVVNDLNGPAAERVASEIALAGGKAIAVAGNVAQREDWQKLREAALEDFGSVQIVAQQRGHHASQQAGARSDRSRVRPRVRGERQEHLLERAGVRAVFPRARRRQLHQYRVDGGRAAAPGLVWYNGSKGAVIIAEQVARGGARAGPDPRELRESGDRRNGSAVRIHGR